MSLEGLLYKNEVHAIQGAVFEVDREMVCGFLEAVYQECLGKESLLRRIPFIAQHELTISLKVRSWNKQGHSPAPRPIERFAH